MKKSIIAIGACVLALLSTVSAQTVNPVLIPISDQIAAVSNELVTVSRQISAALHAQETNVAPDEIVLVLQAATNSLRMMQLDSKLAAAEAAIDRARSEISSLNAEGGDLEFDPAPLQERIHGVKSADNALNQRILNLRGTAIALKEWSVALQPILATGEIALRLKGRYIALGRDWDAKPLFTPVVAATPTGVRDRSSTATNAAAKPSKSPSLTAANTATRIATPGPAAPATTGLAPVASTSIAAPATAASPTVQLTAPAVTYYPPVYSSQTYYPQTYYYYYPQSYYPQTYYPQTYYPAGRVYYVRPPVVTRSFQFRIGR